MRILFGVQGTGNGHISRCRTLAIALKNAGAQVDYIFSGRSPEDYFDMQAFGDYKTFRGISFITHDGKIDLRKTVQNIRAFRLYKDFKALNLSQYDCIISDFEPVTAWAARSHKRECLGISNQSTSLYTQPEQYSLVAKMIMKFYAPASKPVGLHWFHFGHPILPPMIDQLTISAEKSTDIVVYLPFESVNDIQEVLLKSPQQRFICFHPEIKQTQIDQNIVWHQLSRDKFREHVASCAGIITNTGFALISEALVSGKKILTKPLSGQFEQLYNADCLNELGMVSLMERLDSTAINHWLTLPSPDPIVYPDVANALAEWIVSGQKESLRNLSQRLWKKTIFPEPIATRIKKLGF